MTTALPVTAPDAEADAEATQAEDRAWLASLGGPSTRELFETLYFELKRAAASQLRREAPGHTLSSTALTHETWLRLSGHTRTRWTGRDHFLAVASTMMRRILINHARARHAAKREALLVPLTLAEAGEVAAEGDAAADVQRLHEALLAYEAIDARAARVVELKFFGGLEVEAIANVLAISTATVKRDWALARAWLHRALAEP